jgi:T5SS/PEP-CTERM-associated repeat protein
MRTISILLTVLIAAIAAQAQVVSDAATRTLANVTNDITGDVTVGTNGAFTLLALSDNALLTNSANGVISLNTTATSNEVRLVSASARWLMGGTLRVGSNGSFSTLVVSNGAFVRANSGSLGTRAGSGSNVVLITGSGSLWSNLGSLPGTDLLVGGGGSGNQLIISNGGRVMGNNGGIVGNNAGASNNLARVTGSGSVWSNAFNVRVGFLGTGNRLLIEAGGSVHCDAGTVGDFGSASNNEALVTGPGSLWTNRSFLTLGNQAVRNRLVVSNGATVWSGTGLIGGVSAASNNQAVVTGAGSVWSNQTFLFLGGSSPGNRADVSDGGWLASNDGSVGQAFTANNNSVVLSGGGSGWNNLGGLTVGHGGNGNVLIASNGATVLSSNATIGALGSTANNNLALITGTGSLWSNRNDLLVGDAGVGNRLVASNGGTVLAGNLIVGFNSLSANNRVTVNGGTLRVTNALGTGILDVRRGTNLLQSGLVEVDHLMMTNQGNLFVFDGGTLLARKITHNNQSQFRVGNGVSPAMFILTGSGPYSFSQLIVSANATLIGGANLTGSIIMQNGSTLVPGGPLGGLGTLGGSANLVLAGKTILEISKDGAARANDQVAAGGIITFTFGTVVVVTNIGPTALAAGDRFQLFTAGSVAGILETLSLPPLGPGLAWNNKLLVDGSIEVFTVVPPSVQTLPAGSIGQTDATLNGVANPNGGHTTTWFEFGFTTNYGNVTPPQLLGDGAIDTNFAIPASVIPGVAYHFRAVASNSLGVTFGADQSFRALTSFFQRNSVKIGAFASQDDLFGQAVAVFEDALLVVGVPGEDSNATGIDGDRTNDNAPNSGAAYVFAPRVVFGTNIWAEQAYLKAGNSGPGDAFGHAVAMSGELIVIGAPGDDSSAPDSGAAYVFVRNGATWSQQAYLKASNPGMGARFGTSVAVWGDTLVVGARGESSNATGVNANQGNDSATNSGAAYVFVRSGTTWTQRAYLKASNTGTGDRFGTSVAVWGDTLVVGALGESSNATGVNGNQSNNSAPDSGAAYVFVRNGTNWVQRAYLKASNTESNDQFGASVTIAGDTVVVGAPFEDSNATGINGGQGDNSATDAGAAYVFVRSGTSWIQRAYLKAGNTGVGDLFGTSVAASGNLIIAGAPREGSNASGVAGDPTNNTAPESGAVYVFLRTGTSWVEQAYLKGDMQGAGDSFGTSVAVSGDSVVGGAIGDDTPAFPPPPVLNSGAVHTFSRSLIGAEIRVEQSGIEISNGDSSRPDFVEISPNTISRGFDIRNTGVANLTGLSITIDGPDAALFSVTTSPTAPVAPNSGTTFTVRFAPTSTGVKTATLHITNNDVDENPFDITLNGFSPPFTQDSDGDGLNDASELLLAPLGFDLQVSQTNLVNLLFSNLGGATSNLNNAGFFTQSQLQALNVDTPLLARDPFTGRFKLTIGVEKATLLTNFFPFPMSAPQTIINAEGKLEFEFSSPENAGFFRLEAR